ncbi:MAG TPA: alkyl sulfatase dimerization domain-containing protein [Acidimicrobiales bacterium]|jgi:glyoxylase-like metal-dependent hydrolase (beta-lactamase superfamily II)|nr:alkyl sulfatase dimerization domain-containing protein [Acidimicrobiales bacterium]
MADDPVMIADRLWRGESSIDETHPFSHIGGLAEVAEGVAFVPSFANVSAFRTDDGLVLVDTGSAMLAQAVHGEIRRWSDERLHTAVYSHGHIDHVFGVPVFEAEAASRGWAAPRVVAHAALPARFDRYVLTAGYNEVVNQRQFSLPNLRWPTEYRYPDSVYEDSLSLSVGGRSFELHHARGETDDHTWTWVPDAKVLCCGDLFIWASPNAGNPQKVQRYPMEWAAALRSMLELDAEWLLPGHGFLVQGADRVRQALTDTAELLESLVEQTLAMMNAGARLDEIVHSVAAPAHLLERPYLRPVYDEPEFVVRNIWRLYGGWYDGDPSWLKPAPAAALAAELAALAGGAAVLADRASLLAGSPQATDADLRLAGHLAELAAQAAPDDAGVHRVRAAVFGRRAEVERSTMSKGVFRWAASESQAKSE